MYAKKTKKGYELKEINKLDEIVLKSLFYSKTNFLIENEVWSETRRFKLVKKMIKNIINGEYESRIINEGFKIIPNGYNHFIILPIEEIRF